MILGIIGLAGLAYGLVGLSVLKSKEAEITEVQKSYDAFHKSLEASPLVDYDAYKVVEHMYADGYIDEDKYKKAIKTLKKSEDMLDSKDWPNWNWDSIQDAHNLTYTDRQTLKETAELYNLMAGYDDVIAGYTGASSNMTAEGIKNAINNNLPNVGSVPTPDYFETNIEPYQIDVEPAKIWTNKELADHHNINYDLNNYYDLIKQGTEANVNLGEYQSAQLANAALKDNTKANVSYLDSIRQNKANAMAEGATLGAKAANDLLANIGALQTFSSNQASTAQNRYNAVDAYLQADAQAKLQANKYFTNLASSLWNDSASLYYADTDMSSQGYKTNATLHNADRDLAGQNAYLNGQMYGNYKEAQSAINASRSTMETNPYLWVFERRLGANGNNVPDAVNFTNNLIYEGYTGFDTIWEYLEANANQNK